MIFLDQIWVTWFVKKKPFLYLLFDSIQPFCYHRSTPHNDGPDHEFQSYDRGHDRSSLNEIFNDQI